MRFSTPQVRDTFTNIVLKGVVHHPSFDLIADEVAEKMSKLNDGRMWMAAHMRRGDCKSILFLS